MAANPKVRLEGHLALDVIIGHTVRGGGLQSHPECTDVSYGVHKAEAWEQFYASIPAQCRR